jgi:hypothetical protein
VSVQDNTVLLNLVFDPASRKPTFERYKLNMGTSPSGHVLIESASRLGGMTLAASEH